MSRGPRPSQFTPDTGHADEYLKVDPAGTGIEYGNPAAGSQPLDADLTAIAGLDSSTPGVIASDGAGWIKKTYTQLKTALGITSTDISDFSAAASAAAPVQSVDTLTGAVDLSGVYAARGTLGTRLGTTTLDTDGNPLLSYMTVYGIGSDGVPYYDPAGPTAGEEAVLYVGSDGGIYVVAVSP